MADWFQAGDPHYFPLVLYPFGAPQSVSTETPLLGLTELGYRYSDLRFVLDNQSIYSVFMVIEHGETASKADSSRVIIEAPPSKEASLEVRDVMRLFWAVSAYSDPDAAYPSASIRWRIVGRSRRK